MTQTYWRMILRMVAGAVALVCAQGWQPAEAQLRIDITQGNVDPMPIAIPYFMGPSPKETTVGSEMVGVISGNLSRSGLFRPLDPKSFIQKADAIGTLPRFGDWRLINAQALVTGGVTTEADGRLRVEFRLWDVFGEQQMEGRVFFTRSDNWRRVAHLISDKIYERLTGETGYFDTRIVFVSESGTKAARVKRLAIMDQDAANQRFLTSGRHLVLTPRFSPAMHQITYLSYINDKPRVYIYDINTGQQEVLGDFPGMTFAPRFSPSGDSVIMSMARNGNSDIYVMNLRTRAVVRLSHSPAIDTSPYFSPDSQYVTFNSDRGGMQQIYVMRASGLDVKRISFGDGRYATPVWSPRGDLIAFTKIYKGRFYIGVMRPDGSGERLLTESFLDEGPTWSPNGRVLMFFREKPSDSRGLGGGSRLHSIDLTGYNEREIPTLGDASDPAWSPLIPLPEGG
ncbi:MAG: Tol-Pal system protein TolB [Alphaproteobacteria bacterium]|nr:Tol-Pal system protein TolB [Alphaproteobacteria bacterium]